MVMFGANQAWVKILNFNVKIGLLIASNCSRALEPEIVIHSEDDGTYAVRPIGGWRVIGPINRKNAPDVKISWNRMAVIEDGTCNLARHHFETNRQVKKTI